MWIWQARDWPHFRFDAQTLQPALAAARQAQGRMLGVASSLLLVELGELQLSGWAAEALATAQIEGEVLQVNSVRESAARRLGLVPAGRVPQDARTEATLDVMQAALAQWAQPLTHEHLLGWHAALFPTGRSGVTRIATGQYRTHPEPMQIVTPRMGKPDLVHYQAPESKDIPAAMGQLIDWFNQSREHTDALVRAAVVHLWFEAVHPFEDGNGRIGRALSEMALAQDARSNQRLFSLSHQLWLDRSAYYAQLQAATSQSDEAHMDVTAWVQWFVRCIEKACLASLTQMQTALAKNRYWGAVNETHADLSASQRKVLNKLFDAQPEGFAGGMSTEKYVAITGVSRATAYRELTALAETGLLIKTGQGRGTRYSLVFA